MSQDIVADALNQIMNAKRIGKTEAEIKMISKVLINILKMMKEKKHIDFKIGEDKKSVVVKIIKMNMCKAVKPRYYVTVDEIEKYMRRFLPSRNFGSLIISTNKGLMAHENAVEQNLGGSVIAYFY